MRFSLLGGLGGFGLHHVPLPLLQHPIPPPSSTTTSPLSSSLTPTPQGSLALTLALSLLPFSSLFFSPYLSLRSRRQ